MSGAFCVNVLESFMIFSVSKYELNKKAPVVSPQGLVCYIPNAFTAEKYMFPLK